MHDLSSDDDEHHPYSLVRTVDGTIGWCAGVLPYRADGELEQRPEEAVEAAVQVLGERLQRAGSSLREVVKVTVFLTDIGWRPHLDAAWHRHWDAPRPARTAIEVRRLPRGAGIELEAVLQHRA